MLRAQIKSENVLLKHKLRTFQNTLRAHGFLSHSFPAYIAAHKLAVKNSTKHVTHPTCDQQEVVTEMLREESGAFAMDDDDIGCVEDLKLEIKLMDNDPVKKHTIKSQSPYMVR